MRIRPLEIWVLSLFLAMAGVAAIHQYRLSERTSEPPAPYSMTVKAHR